MAVFQPVGNFSNLEGRGVHPLSQYRVAVEQRERPVAGAEHRLFGLLRVRTTACGWGGPRQTRDLQCLCRI